MLVSPRGMTKRVLSKLYIYFIEQDLTVLNCPDYPCLNGGTCIGGCGNERSFCNCTQMFGGKYCKNFRK